MPRMYGMLRNWPLKLLAFVLALLLWSKVKADRLALGERDPAAASRNIDVHTPLEAVPPDTVRHRTDSLSVLPSLELP